MVSFFRKMDAVESQINIPGTGIHKADLQLPGFFKKFPYIVPLVLT